MECKYCKRPIKILLNSEMQCFGCYNKNKNAKPQRHNHKTQPPRV